MDSFTRDQRSRLMARIHAKNTTPERAVRSLLHSLGFRFRLHRKDLPGCPDIVLPKHDAVVLVNGCFWHRHRNCKLASTPKSNRHYWQPKFERTVVRDAKNRRTLRRLGWHVFTVWECETKDLERLSNRLKRLLSK